MRQRVFFVDDKNLIEYLQKYGRGPGSKDYEFSVSLYAKKFWERKLGQNLVICFEQNDKMHKYPERFIPTAEELKDILLTYNNESTPVDFALAPVTFPEKIDGFAYPFQIKSVRLKVSDTTTKDLADFINTKANKYRANDTCLIIGPQLIGENKDKKMFQIDELKSLLQIDEEALRAIYIFQSSKDGVSFLPLWVSPKALNETN